jgi:hypothetical protein
MISADGLMKWVRKSEALSNREEAYLTLVDGPVRRAWVGYLSTAYMEYTG